MAKKRPAPHGLPQRARESLQDARDQIALGDFETAFEILEELKERYPRRREILAPLMDLCIDFEDEHGALEVAEEWHAVEPGAAGASYARIRAYILNDYLILARQACDAFLAAHPQDERAPIVRELLELARVDERTVLPAFAPNRDEALARAELLERGRLAMDLGHLDEARDWIDQTLARAPGFTPALNNRSLVEMAQGDLAAAIATMESALAHDPHNVHARANLTRYLMMTGQDAAAGRIADGLRGATKTNADETMKRLEAFAFVGDDLEVLRLVRELGDVADGLALHLAGVAAWRLGRTGEARRYWTRALELDPELEEAEEALDELELAPAEQEGPIAFNLLNWVPEVVVVALNAAIDPGRRKPDAATRATRAALERYPFVVQAAPTLLARGGRAGRMFVLGLAAVAEIPELLAALKSHVLTRLGSDGFRLTAAQLLVEKGVLPAGPVRLWVDAAWRDVLLFDIAITDGPLRLFPHSKAVAKRLSESIQATRLGDYAEAERLLAQALKEEPEAPDLLNNLAAVFAATGRSADAEALLEALVAKHADYSLPRLSLAGMRADQGDLEAARAIVAPLLERRQMHQLELAALCATQVRICVRANERELAKQWLDLWQRIRPDDPTLAPYLE